MREAWDSRWSSRLKVSSGIRVQLVVRAEATEFLSRGAPRRALNFGQSCGKTSVAFRPGGLRRGNVYRVIRSGCLPSHLAQFVSRRFLNS